MIRFSTCIYILVSCSWMLIFPIIIIMYAHNVQSASHGKQIFLQNKSLNMWRLPGPGCCVTWAWGGCIPGTMVASYWLQGRGLWEAFAVFGMRECDQWNVGQHECVQRRENRNRVLAQVAGTDEKVWTWAPEPERKTLVLLVTELLLGDSLLWNGLQAASALGLRGAAHCAAFTQVRSERSVMDLLEVLLDFTPGVLQEIRLALRGEDKSKWAVDMKARCKKNILLSSFRH